MFITRLISPATKVRIEILEALKITVQNHYKTYLPKVNMVEMKPYFFFQKGGMEKRYTFTGALLKFQKLLHKVNFLKAEDLAKSLHFRGENLEQFVVFRMKN